MAFELTLIGVSLLLLLGVMASKVSDRFGIPALVLFLLLGMLAGSDGPGGIYFDDAALAQAIGVVALAFILFSGGLDTDWKHVRPVLKEGMLLSTTGVVLTAAITAACAHWLLDLPVTVALLLGSIISSTDAAAVFAILRSRSVSLKGLLKPLLELESGSNDPMAVFLTIGLVRVLSSVDTSLLHLVGMFCLQMALGTVAGYVGGRVLLILLNRLKLGYEGLYMVVTLSWVLFMYSATAVVGGNGFLAVYIAGILIGNHEFIHKRSLLRFHDGIAWLMQIAMFLTLGLLVFPSRLISVAVPGLLLATCLMFVARPLSVLACLSFSPLTWREKIYVSWVGLRGAVPIILATYPMLANITQSGLIFDVVFFVVLTSALLQGYSVPIAAHWLKVDAPLRQSPRYPLEYTPVAGSNSEVRELVIVRDCPLANKAIVDLGLPADFLIILISRDGEFLIPNGATVLLPGDRLLTLSTPEAFRQVEEAILCSE